MKPHDILRLFRADEIAECWDGVSDELYRALWHIVPLMPKRDLEDFGPADFVGVDNVTKYWDKLTKEQQEELNKLAERREEWQKRYTS